MKQRHWVEIRIARTLGRTILKTEIHNVVYFIMMIICFIHTCLCFVDQSSDIHMLLKWFDPSQFVAPAIIVLALAGPCLIIAFLIVLQFVWGIKQNTIQTTITKHYLIKISSILAFMLAYTLCLPLIKCAVAVQNGQNFVVKIIGISILVVFLVIIYPFSMFLLTDLSPQNNNVYAVVDSPNVLFILNMYRPIASLIVATGHDQYVIIPTVFFFILLLIALLKLPAITWKFNIFSQSLISSILWTILCRFSELATRQKLLLPIYLIGLPIFVLFMVWLLKARVVSILKRQNNTVLKLKILYFLLVNTDKQCQELDIFIMHHYRICPLEICSCHKIVGQFRLQKATNQQNKKLQTIRSKSYKKASSHIKAKLSSTFGFYKNSKIEKTITKQQNIQGSFVQQRSQGHILKTKEKQSWFQLLQQLQNEQFLIDKLKEMPITERQLQLRKAKQIILDQTEILHYYLDKQYQSLRNLWFVDEQLTNNNLISLFFLTRFYIQEQRQQQTIKLKSRQEGSNQYALNYYELQTKLMFFRELLLKAILKTEQFWAELNGKKPDQYKLTVFIKQVLKSQQNIYKQLKNYLSDKNKSNNNNDYEQSWEMKIKKIIQNTYVPFEIAMRLSKSPKLNEDANLQLKQIQPKTLSKNLLFYDCNSKTGMGIVNVQEGDQFGTISVTNKQFWTLLNCPRYDKARINHFLVKQMHQYHDKTVVDFLKKNKHFLNFHRGFIIDGTKHLVQIQFSVQLLPHVFNGLFGAAFLQQIKSSKAIFLTNRASNILAYNVKFGQTFLEKRNLIEFDQIISKQVIMKLEDQKKCKVFIQNDEYLVQRCHVIFNEANESQNLYLCEISQQWDQIPLKTKVIQDQIKEQFYVKSEQERASRLSNPLPIKQKTKQKKEQFQGLINIARSQKSSQNISKWSKFITISLILICLVALVCCGLSQLKLQKYKEANKTYTDLTNLIQDITQIAYLARKINLIQFSNQQQSIDQYLRQMKMLEDKITEQKQSLKTGLLAQSYTSYQVTSDGNIITSKTTYDMMIQKYLLSAYTTFLTNIADQNYDYVKSENKIPYSNAYVNFLTFLYNNYYTVLPITTKQFRNYLNQKCTVLIGIMSSTPIVLMTVLIIAVCVVAQIITIWLRLKINKTFWASLKLLQKLNICFIQERMQVLRTYKEGSLADLYQNKKLKQKLQSKEEQKKVKEKEPLSKRIQAGNQSIMMQISEYSKQLSMQFEDSTARDFQDTNREKNNKQFRRNQKNRFKADDAPKIKVILTVLLSLVPIIGIGISILGVQISSIKQMHRSLQLKELYSKKMEGVRLIKSYSKEIGYETGDFIVSNLQLHEQLPNIFSNTYEVLRGIKEKQVQQKVRYRQALMMPNSSFCGILSKINGIDGYIIEECNADESAQFANKSDSEIIVDYIETARNVLEQYKNLNISKQEQRRFTADARHLKFQRTCLHLVNLEQYIMDCFNWEFEAKVRQYQAVIIILCITIVCMIGIVKQLWVPYQIRQMEFQIDEIKTILLLISQAEISENTELKQQITSNFQLYTILK